MTQRVKVTIAYDGAAFSGWQIQCGHAEKTVQGAIEFALLNLSKKRIVVHGSGRTDAGVHADGQVFHFDIPRNRSDMDWRRFFHAMLPPSVQVRAVELVDEGFHARFSALGKRYEYVLWSHTDKAPLKLAPYVWSTPPVHQDTIAQALEFLIGEHDFASFQKQGSTVDNTVRTITEITPAPGMCGPFMCPSYPHLCTWRIEGNGFLRQMVRNIMGLLVWVGTGKVAVEDIPAIMRACDRKSLPSPAAPGHALTLAEVYYTQGQWDNWRNSQK